jgi:hypothetical protein
MKLGLWNNFTQPLSNNNFMRAGRSILMDVRKVDYTRVCMYVCIRGGLLQPLHLDPEWSIVLNPDDR